MPLAPAGLRGRRQLDLDGDELRASLHEQVVLAHGTWYACRAMSTRGPLGIGDVLDSSMVRCPATQAEVRSPVAAGDSHQGRPVIDATQGGQDLKCQQLAVCGIEHEHGAFALLRKADHPAH